MQISVPRRGRLGFTSTYHHSSSPESQTRLKRVIKHLAGLCPRVSVDGCVRVRVLWPLLGWVLLLGSCCCLNDLGLSVMVCCLLAGFHLAASRQKPFKQSRSSVGPVLLSWGLGTAGEDPGTTLLRQQRERERFAPSPALCHEHESVSFQFSARSLL